MEAQLRRLLRGAMMKTLMGIVAKNLTASDEESRMPDPVNS